MVQNFREIAENPIIENFRDKNFVIATFFREYHCAAAPVRTVNADNSCCSSAHNFTWLVEKKLDKTYIYIWALSALSAFCCRLFGHLFNVVVGGFDTGKTKEVV